MTFADYICDYRRAYATEIMNANATTVEEMMEVIDKLNKESNQFCYIEHEWLDICFGYDDVIANLESNNARLERFIEFKNSKVASLIAKYIENQTPELLKEIEAEIEATNNPFKIIIYENYLNYDLSRNEFDKFYIDNLFTYYTTDGKFDVDEDIERLKQRIKWDLEDKEKYEKRKEKMLAKYGDCLLKINLYED